MSQRPLACMSMVAGLVAIILGAAPIALAQPVLDAPGEFAAGWRSFRFDDGIFGQGMIDGRIYYPAVAAGRDQAADPSGGPYPVVAFQHGWLGRPSNYDDLCLHLASWGYIVASTGTETGLFPDIEQFARDTRSVLHWVLAESDDPASWLADMADDGDWSAIGHSMGGGTLSALIGVEPRVRTIIGLQAADNAGGRLNMTNYNGNVFMIAGSADWIVPSEVVYAWTQLAATNARRNVFWEVQGMGHNGCQDNPPNGEPMSGGEQARSHRRLLTGILEAEVRGDENRYLETLGEALDIPVRSQTWNGEPILWADFSLTAPTTEITCGLAGDPNRAAVLAWSLVPDSIPTRFGELGLSPDDLTIVYQQPLPVFGWTEVALPIEPGWSARTLYLQGFGGDRLSRVVALLIP
ncbi:MAG: alpha/beta hydrolase family protein [Phycisphaerales bacterium]